MTQIRLGEYCCQGADRILDTTRFSASDLRIASRGNRELIFSPLGNEPVAPRVALVGITPGGQSEAFERYIRCFPVRDAAKRAAFEGAQNQIKNCFAPKGLLKASRSNWTVTLMTIQIFLQRRWSSAASR